MSPAVHSDFAAAFTPGTRFRDETYGTVEVTTRAIGELKVPSGRIVASDPFTTDFEKPDPSFAIAAPTGVFPVELAIARFPASGDERVACARVRFADAAPAVSWTAAAFEGSKPDGEDDIYGYGVDAGTGCFFDREATGPVDEAVSEGWLAAMEQRQVSTWSWHVADRGEANIVMFSSGIGDGLYTSWWGHDASGRIVELVTDFEVLIGPLYERFELSLPLARGRVRHPLLVEHGVTMRAPWLSGSTAILGGKSFARVELGDGSPVEVQRKSYGAVRRYSWKPPGAGVRLVVAVMVGIKPLDALE